MNKQTLKALQGSIKKWEAIVAGTGVDRGASNCPLCKLFFWDSDCRGCPVFAKTGKPGCYGTPYDEYRDAKSAAAKMKHARAELKFLKSLVPK